MKTVGVVTFVLALVIAFIGVIEIVEADGTPDGDTTSDISDDDIKFRAKREIPVSEALIQLAKKYGCPFAETCLKKLSADVFGSGRAGRSTDVVIFNKSSLKFKCTSFKCKYGRYTNSLLPEDNILPKASSVFGMESTGYLTGVRCHAKYESANGTFFEVSSRNPFFGKNSLRDSNSPNLVLTNTLGSGNNNQARWIVDDAYKGETTD